MSILLFCNLYISSDETSNHVIKMIETRRIIRNRTNSKELKSGVFGHKQWQTSIS